MFSQRTNWPRQTNEISQKIEQSRQQGKIFFDLTISNPTQCQFDFPETEIIAALGSVQNLNYQPCAQGTLDARRVVQEYYRERGFKIPVERILLTASTSEGYSLIFRLLANPHDVVLFPEPSYPLFQFLVDINDLKMRTYQLVYQQQGWRISAESLQMAVTEHPKAMVVVNPNNPTGSLISAADLNAINAAATQTESAIISDEVFLDFLFDQRIDFPSLAGNEKNLTFVLSGISKALAMPQMKLSWIVINGPADLVVEAISRLEVLADTFLSVNTSSQNALRKWLTLQPQIHTAIMKRLEHNRQFLQQQSETVKVFEALYLDGGWYGVCRVKKEIDEEKLILELLEKKGVFVHPGYFFDFKEEGFLVVSLLTPETIFAQGVERLCDFLK